MGMNFKRGRGSLLYFSVFCMLFVSYSSVASPQTTNALKAAYLYNIAKFTRWPAASWTTQNDPFNFCFYGATEVYEEALGLQQKLINGHPIKLFKPESEIDFQGCHALYIETDKSRRYRYLLSLINNQTVLVIADESPFFEQGGLVNLVEIGQRLRFQVNKRQLDNTNLQFSSKLLKLAIILDN